MKLLGLLAASAIAGLLWLAGVVLAATGRWVLGGLLVVIASIAIYLLLVVIDRRRRRRAREHGKTPPDEDEGLDAAIDAFLDRLLPW